MITTCIDCGAKKRSVCETHSFQCDRCFQKSTSKLSKIAPGKNKYKSKKQIIRDMYSNGKSDEEIREKTRIKIGYIREVISQYKKEVAQ